MHGWRHWASHYTIPGPGSTTAADLVSDASIWSTQIHSRLLYTCCLREAIYACIPGPRQWNRDRWYLRRTSYIAISAKVGRWRRGGGAARCGDKFTREAIWFIAPDRIWRIISFNIVCACARVCVHAYPWFIGTPRKYHARDRLLLAARRGDGRIILL